MPKTEKNTDDKQSDDPYESEGTDTLVLRSMLEFESLGRFSDDTRGRLSKALDDCMHRDSSPEVEDDEDDDHDDDDTNQGDGPKVADGSKDDRTPPGGSRPASSTSSTRTSPSSSSRKGR